VTLHTGFGMRRLLDELCAAAQFQSRIVLEASNIATAGGLVAAGIGISLMPIDGSDYAPGVIILPLADSDAYRDVGLIWNSTRPLSRPARQFIESAAASQISGVRGGVSSNERGASTGVRS